MITFYKSDYRDIAKQLMSSLQMYNKAIMRLLPES